MVDRITGFFLLITITVALYICGVGLFSTFVSKADAAESLPKSKGCTVWFIRTDNNRRQIFVSALSDARSGVDRLATAIRLAERITASTDYQLVEVSLYGAGTTPYLPQLNGNTTTAWASYSSNTDSWSGLYSTTPTSSELTAKNGADGNPSLNAEYVDNDFIRGFEFEDSEEPCDISMLIKCQGSYVNPKIVSFAPNDHTIRKKVLQEFAKFKKGQSDSDSVCF